MLSNNVAINNNLTVRLIFLSSCKYISEFCLIIFPLQNLISVNSFCLFMYLQNLPLAASFERMAIYPLDHKIT